MRCKSCGGDMVQKSRLRLIFVGVLLQLSLERFNLNYSHKKAQKSAKTLKILSTMRL
jgi:hypothetical protein